MKQKSPPLLMLFVIALLLFNPGEIKHRAGLTKFISERDKNADEGIINEKILQKLTCRDYYLCSFCEMEEIKVTRGYLGRVVILNNAKQKEIYRRILDGASNP